MNISLTKGYVTTIDDCDYNLIKRFNWFIFPQKNHLYAATRDKNTLILLHRLIMNFPKGKQIDHIDGNGLNNQRSNLRECTFLQNIRNSAKQKTYGNKPTTSKYKGVSLSKGKWRALIYKHPKLITLGRFQSESEAALAYNRAAVEIFGSYARLNDIKEHGLEPLFKERNG